ncbi:tetrahydrocannabinolic acid synthase-like [Melia azedarach]|uniref:Tetrahydrocannabinolic acid synthase-like n=1 Tax=Melia azedarach TaxID=155640 RepID=A0ACC1X800_MELAZ|nr:tetrahydrocannabinolic acid synthase-like [Melia azedarach]
MGVSLMYLKGAAIGEVLPQDCREKPDSWISCRLPEEDNLIIVLSSYDGMVSKIPESEIPFQQSKGNILEILDLAAWLEGAKNAKKHVYWIRQL